ncbi:MAG: histidine--tRNA ligase [Desulfobacteraceae bacterium]|nr:histidine--tRNA ligase [Desulfobacteraceae bacterium]
METLQAVRGMNDILPDQVGWWQRVERTAREVLENFGYREIRTPVVEKLDLFSRGIGENTDVVEKEMYAFEDRSGDWIALRPEVTASIARSYIQHKLYADPTLQKFYAIGPMFRHERPQKGRYRQFHQIDAEVFGIDSPMIDAEIMHMLRIFLEKVGISGVTLHINTLGCPECRKVYREVLKRYLTDKGDEFCPDCMRRRETNPLRVFDCKVERCQAFLDGAPALIEYICNDCRTHFDAVMEMLDKLGTPYVVDPKIVRGLDYYMRTTFEVVTDRLGSQNAVGGGGRYNGLVQDLGGPEVPGIGFAIGMERLIMLLQQEQQAAVQAPDAFIAAVGEHARTGAFLLLQQMRAHGLEVEMEFESRSLKSQMRRADKLGPRFVFILGEDEINRGEIQLRDMQEKTQQVLPLDTAALTLSQMIGKNSPEPVCSEPGQCGCAAQGGSGTVSQE